jgi:hypothetical protein
MSQDKHDGSGKGDARTDPRTRQAALLLSGLVLTPDGALELFRERRAASSNLAPPQLRQARDILDALSDAITSSEPEGPRRVEQMWQALQGERGKGEAPGTLGAGGSSPEARPAPGAAKMPATPSSIAPPRPTPRPLSIPAPAVGPVAAPELRPDVQPAMLAAAAPPRPLPAEPLQPSASQPAFASGIDFEALNRVKLDETKPSTMWADEAALQGPALPFRQGDAQPPPTTAGEPPPANPMGTTVEGEAISPLAGTTLPFHHAAADKAAAAEEHASLPAGPDAPGQATAPAQIEAGLAPHLAAITVEQYATLCAECAAHPAWLAHVQARYGVQSAAERAALDSHWQQRMAADPQLPGLLRWHYARYEEWLKQQR